MKRLIALAAAVCGMTILSAGFSAPAQAAGCLYDIYHDRIGRLGMTEHGYAAKMEWACNRARRQCNRKLDRARKRGTLPRHEPREIRCVRLGS